MIILFLFITINCKINIERLKVSGVESRALLNMRMVLSPRKLAAADVAGLSTQGARDPQARVMMSSCRFYS